MKTYFSTEEIKEQLIETLKGYEGYYSDLHQEAFNTDYYIIGTYKARQALEAYGVYEAIGRIVAYEKEHFGELYTALSDSEKVANMLYYILSEEYTQNHEVFNKIFDDVWNKEATDENNTRLIDALTNN